MNFCRGVVGLLLKYITLKICPCRSASFSGNSDLVFWSEANFNRGQCQGQVNFDTSVTWCTLKTWWQCCEN